MKAPHAQALECVRVIECTGGTSESGTYRLQDVELDVQAYQLQLTPERESVHQSQDSAENTDDVPHFRIVKLPNREFDGLWESYVDSTHQLHRLHSILISCSLQFDEPIQTNMLQAVARMGE